MIFAIVSILVGTLLGLRFRVFILVPTITFALVFVIGVGVAREAGIWWIALEMVLVATALQLGYLGGSAFAATRATDSSRSRLQSTQRQPTMGTGARLPRATNSLSKTSGTGIRSRHTTG